LAHASLAAKPTDNRHLCPQGLLTDGIGENIIRAGAIKEGPESRLWRRGPRGDRWQHRKSKDLAGHAGHAVQTTLLFLCNFLNRRCGLFTTQQIASKKGLCARSGRLAQTL
jgi:hypothetical protein